MSSRATFGWQASRLHCLLPRNSINPITAHILSQAFWNSQKRHCEENELWKFPNAMSTGKHERQKFATELQAVVFDLSSQQPTEISHFCEMLRKILYLYCSSQTKSRTVFHQFSRSINPHLRMLEWLHLSNIKNQVVAILLTASFRDDNRDKILRI